MVEGVQTDGRAAARQGQVLALDLLRCAAALMVVGFHLAYTRSGQGDVYPELEPFTWFGWIGVPIFFVISGFVIAFSAEDSGWGDFVRRRFLRLYPALLICMLLTLGVRLAFEQVPDLGTRILHSLLIVPGQPYVDEVYWTLAVEVQFYALIAVVLALRRFHWLAGVLAGLLAICAAGWAIKALDLSPVLALAFDRSGLLKPAAHFVLGGAIWLCSRRITLFRLGLATAAFAVAVVSLYSSLAAGGGAPAAAAGPLLLYAGCIAVIIAGVRYNRLLGEWLNGSLVRQIGLATYPIYLIHNEIGAVVLASSEALGRWPALAIALAVCLAISLTVSLWLEPRLRDFMAMVLPNPRHHRVPSITPPTAPASNRR